MSTPSLLCIVIIVCVTGYKSTCQLSPILARVFDGRKSLKPIAAREFKPLLIVLGWTMDMVRVVVRV